MLEGFLFRLDEDKSLHKLDDKLIVTNGVALSPDYKTLYLIEIFTNPSDDITEITESLMV